MRPLGCGDVARRQPEQQAPPVQKLRIRYAKRGRARFTSHRDFSRAFERALRRAAIPMAISSGFNPHPRISFANASPTGAATEAEYLEIGLAERCDPDKVRQVLGEAMPPGLDILAVVEAKPGALADLLTGSRWRISWPEAASESTRAALDAFLATDSVEVERLTKNGIRTFDARAAVVSLTLDAEPDETLGVRHPGLVLLTRHQTPLVRPDDVLQAIGRVAEQSGIAFEAPSTALITRLEQGILTDSGLADPFAEA